MSTACQRYTPNMDCMICDLYKVFDRHLADETGGIEDVRDVISDLVSVLPPRGHGFHKLAIWEQMYKSRGVHT